MATGNMRNLRMFRRLLALMALLCATIEGAPLSLGQTPKFEGVYKGTIVLTGASGSITLGVTDCNPSTNKFRANHDCVRRQTLFRTQGNTTEYGGDGDCWPRWHGIRLWINTAKR